MSRKCIYSIIIVLLSACSRQDNGYMLIQGSTSERYNDYNMYLVPLPDPTPQTVDSVKISHGTFHFKVKADSMRMYDIRLSRRAKGRVERLLLVAEPGVLKVKIDTVSRGGGTPLNDKLQLWKEQLMRTAGEASTQAELDSFRDSTYLLIKTNMNAMGGFIYSLMRNRLDSAQVATIDSMGIEKWLPKKQKP